MIPKEISTRQVILDSHLICLNFIPYFLPRSRPLRHPHSLTLHRLHPRPNHRPRGEDRRVSIHPGRHRPSHLASQHVCELWPNPTAAGTDAHSKSGKFENFPFPRFHSGNTHPTGDTDCGFIRQIEAWVRIQIKFFSFNNWQKFCSSGTPPYKWNTTLRHYTTLQLLSGSVEQGLAEVTFPLMGLGLLFSVALNFACIRFIHPGMNLGYYALYPFLSTVVWVLIWTLVPVAIGIHETTKESLISWRRAGEWRCFTDKTVKSHATPPILCGCEWPLFL